MGTSNVKATSCTGAQPGSLGRVLQSRPCETFSMFTAQSPKVLDMFIVMWTQATRPQNSEMFLPRGPVRSLSRVTF